MPANAHRDDSIAANAKKGRMLRPEPGHPRLGFGQGRDGRCPPPQLREERQQRAITAGAFPLMQSAASDDDAIEPHVVAREHGFKTVRFIRNAVDAVPIAV